jgi:hypothetical protein
MLVEGEFKGLKGLLEKAHFNPEKFHSLMELSADSDRQSANLLFLLIAEYR